MYVLYIELTISFLIGKNVLWIFEFRVCDVLSPFCRLYYGHVKVTGNHVKFAHFVMLAVSEEA